jgi:hypothetical protein
MTQTIVGDLARHSFAAVQQQAAGLSVYSPDTTADLLSAYKVAAYALDESRKRLQAFLDTGSERRTLVSLLCAFRDTLELGIATANAASKIVRNSGLSAQEERDSEAYLEGTRVRAHEMREWTMALLSWLEAERPRINPEALPTGAGDREAYITFDQFVNAQRPRRSA